MIGPNFAEQIDWKIATCQKPSWLVFKESDGCFFNNKWVIGMKQIQQLEPLGALD